MMLIKNLTILTQDGGRRIIKDGAIFIDGENIADIGNSNALAKKYKNAKTIDGKGMVAMPGLINAHTHAAMTLLRGYADDMHLMDWLAKKIWPAEEKMTSKDIFKGTYLACEEMLQSGTTVFNNMYWQSEEELKAAKKAGVKEFLGITALDVGMDFGPEHVQKEYERLKKKIGKKIKITIAPHSVYTVKKESLIRCAQFARKNDLPLHIHISETETEVLNCKKATGLRPVEHLEKIGFFEGNKVIAAHLCWLNEQEIKILAKRKVSAAHCPSSNLKLASGVMPFGKLQKAGVNICLGTDGASSNNNLDMFWEMKLAALIHKWNEKNPTVADAQKILDCSTINGAKALEIENETGSLEIGKKADIILIDFKKPHLTPCFSEISHIVYSAKGSDVAMTIVNGKILFSK